MDEPTGKRCPRCGETKSTDDFYRNRAAADGLAFQCKACAKELHRQWVKANPEKALEIDRRSHKVQLERAREEAARNPAPPKAVKEGARAAYARAYAARQHAANRKAVFDHYGWSCACCGTTKRLSIDHVNGDGPEHRAQIGTGSSYLYRWLIANGFPGGFQVLCGWCNHSKADGLQCRIDHRAA